MGFFMVASAASLFAAPAAAVPAGYPTKPIRLIVGFAPGGATDFSARVIAAKLAEIIGQQVIVDNRPGANGNIGAEIVAKAEPDGYTILLATSGLGPSPSLVKLPFDIQRDLAPIIQTVDVTNILSLHTSVAANSVKELIALAKSQPGKLNYGSSGIGSTQHLSGELFNSLAGTKIVHVAYKGGGPSMTDLLAGRLQLIFATASTALPQISAGKIKGIAVASKKRSAVVPNMPTIDESGLPGFDSPDWHGMLAPAKTPRAIINRLNAEVTKVLASPDVKAALFKGGQTPEPGTPEQFGAFIDQEIKKWAKLIKEQGIKAEF
jgi:tripartite-type tricarboxylate transporter receptor subunit TctC